MNIAHLLSAVRSSFVDGHNHLPAIATRPEVRQYREATLESLGLAVRIRASAPDPYAGLKGPDYIRARGLKPGFLTKPVQCEHCAREAMLPTVQRVIIAHLEAQPS